MPNFHSYMMRHSESWLLDIIEQAERNQGIKPLAHKTLEDRWNIVMREPEMPVALAA